MDFEECTLRVNKEDNNTKTHSGDIPFLPELIDKDFIDRLKQYTPNGIQTHFKRAFKRLKLNEKGIVIHSMRSTFISCCLFLNINPKQVQAWARHAKVEMMSVTAFKPFLRCAHNVFGKLYEGLIFDINRSSGFGHTFSDGYDFAQDAICYLCENIGRKLKDVIGLDKRGKVLTVGRACLRTVTNKLNKLLRVARKSVCFNEAYQPTAASVVTVDVAEPKRDLSVAGRNYWKFKLNR